MGFGDTISIFCGILNYIVLEILRGEEYGEDVGRWVGRVRVRV